MEDRGPIILRIGRRVDAGRIALAKSTARSYEVPCLAKNGREIGRFWAIGLRVKRGAKY